MKRNPAEFRLLLHYSIKKGGDWFTVSNDALDLVAQGESEENALANFREVVMLFVESCYRRGTLYEVLNESGVLLPVDAQEPQKGTMEILMPLTAREKANDTRKEILKGMDEQLIKYRERLSETFDSLNMSYDKLLVTLSGGALVVSVTFINYAEYDIECLKWLFWGWLVSILCLFFMAVKIIIAIKGYRKAVGQVDARTIGKEIPGGIFTRIWRWLFPIPFMLCFTGISLISYFVYCSLM